MALGASAQWVVGVCGVFTFARVVHAVAYIKAKQPFRTLSFVVGQLCTLVAMVQVARAALAIVM